MSLPVKWGEETRRFMAQAAEKAGFKQISIMDEPTAALYATLCRKMNEINQQGLLRTGESGYLLLVDMGAGTTDLAVCRYTVDSRPGEIIRADRIKNEIVATWPEDRNAATFGGREVDRVLEDYVESYLKDCGLPDAMAAQMVRGTASNSAKLWKETAVSKNLNEGKRVETCGFVSGYMAFLPQQKPFPAFGRTELETMLGDKLAQFKGLVAECLQKASETEPEILAKGLDLVILTGGHSAWYFTEELLNGTMPGLALPQLERVQREKSRVIRLTNPQETVALGLVYSQLPFQVGKEEEKSNPERLKVGQQLTATIEAIRKQKSEQKSKEKAAVTQANLPENRTLASWARDFIRHYQYDGQLFNKQIIRRNDQVSNLRRHLKIPKTTELYLYHDDSFFQRGTNGFAMGYEGIYYNAFNFANKVSWSDFINGDILPWGVAAEIYVCMSINGQRRGIAVYARGIRDDQKELHRFCTALQAHLRLQAQKLQEQAT